MFYDLTTEEATGKFKQFAKKVLKRLDKLLVRRNIVAQICTLDEPSPEVAAVLAKHD